MKSEVLSIIRFNCQFAIQLFNQQWNVSINALKFKKDIG